MRLAKALLALASLFVFSSCAGVPRYVNPDPRHETHYRVALWIEPSSGLRAADVLEGCDGWREKGVECRIVSRQEDADIRVHASGKTCMPDKDGMRTLAYAYRGGDMVFNSLCFIRSGDLSYDRKMFVAVATHEVGHELGIWEHVEPSCSSKSPRHPNGQQVCGRAVMNPTYDEDVLFITPIDSLAFDVRDTDVSVIDNVKDRPDRPRDPDCVFRIPVR